MTKANEHIDKLLVEALLTAKAWHAQTHINRKGLQVKFHSTGSRYHLPMPSVYSNPK